MLNGTARSLPAAAAQAAGIHAALGFPIRVGRDVIGVVEFFSPDIQRPDDELLGMVDAIGSEVGQFIHRERAEQALRASESRKSAILDTALDAIITIDDASRIVDFNPAAERIFGYRRAEVLGQPLPELVIPPPLREQHRQGLSRYLATGKGGILGQRVEMRAMRADGSEFDAEVTVTPVHGAEVPLFTGFVRDIDEGRPEHELRRSQLVAHLERLP